MESLSRKTILKISQEILSNGDIIAKHGTSIDNAKRIMETGFNYNKTSFVIQKSSNIESLYNYMWKENKPSDATNVIIQVPIDFIKDLLGFNEEQYNSWISHIKEKGLQEVLLMSFTDFEFEKNRFDFKAHIPKEFIYGTFIWCNNITYHQCLGSNVDLSNNLNFIKNENFYSNLTKEEKKKFVEGMRNKVFKKDKNQNKNKTNTENKKNQTSFNDENPGGDNRC